MKAPSLRRQYLLMPLVVLSVALGMVIGEYRIKLQRFSQDIEDLEKLTGDLHAKLWIFDNYFASLSRYLVENQRLGPPAPGERRVIFFGDSITEAWDMPSFFSGAAFRAVNRGGTGQTTNQMVVRFAQDVLDLKPYAVVLTAGTNDVVRGVAAQATKGDIAAMIAMSQMAGVRVFAGTLPPIHPGIDPQGTRRAALEKMNAWLRTYCSEGHCVLLDFHGALCRGPSCFDAERFKDELHPNARGYEIMAKVVKEALKP